MKKKALSLALALALCLGLTVPVLAAEPYTFHNSENGIVYDVTNVVNESLMYDIYGGGDEPIWPNLTCVGPVNITASAKGLSVEYTKGYFLTSDDRREEVSDTIQLTLTEPGVYDFWFSWDNPEPDSGYFVCFLEIDITEGTDAPESTTPPPAEVKTANPTNDKLTVNGAAADPTVYKIGGSNYFKIRDVAAVLNGTEKQFAVGYSGGKVTVTSGQPYEANGKELAGPPAAAREASPSNDAILIDGAETSLTVYKIGGSNYFKLRDLGKALNFYVGWEAGRGIYIETDKPYSE